MRKNGFELCMSSKWLFDNDFYKRQVSHLSFMTVGFVQ
jgi:hypothetical protein